MPRPRSSGPQVYRAGGRKQDQSSGNNIVLAVVGMLVVLLVAGLGAFNYAHQNANPLTPRETVEKLMSAEVKGDWGTMYDMMDWPPSIKRQIDEQGGRSWFAGNSKEYMTDIAIANYRIDSVDDHGDSATAIVHAKAMAGGKSLEFDYEVELKLVGGQWKVKPNLPERLQSQQ